LSEETLVFDDASLVRDLCGPTDSYLVLIENKLDVRLDAKSNEITLRGGDHKRMQA